MTSDAHSLVTCLLYDEYSAAAISVPSNLLKGVLHYLKTYEKYTEH